MVLLDIIMFILFMKIVTHLICILFEEMSWNGFLSQLLFVPARRCVCVGISVPRNKNSISFFGGEHNDFEL